jgi:hypothetical protein
LAKAGAAMQATAIPKINDADFMAQSSRPLASHFLAKAAGTLRRENGGKWAVKLRAGNIQAQASTDTGTFEPS